MVVVRDFVDEIVSFVNGRNDVVNLEAVVIDVICC